MTAPLELADAQARLLALAAPLPGEHVAVEEALGRYLTVPLMARRTQPAGDMSAMDGYAVRGQDVPGPWQVIGESAAGHPFAGLVGSGEAVRIATGALLPDGADCVIIQEDCAREGDTLRLTGTLPSPLSKHIRREGLDFRDGAMLLPAGTRIGPAQIALALSAGHRLLEVARRPRITLIDSGDELASPGVPCARHQIPASNGAMLAAMVAGIPCCVSRIGPVADDRGALIAAFHAATEDDLIVTSGGASVGDHDLIRPALQAIGADLAFWRVAIRPGKPLLVATRARPGRVAQIILGLPGNPVSSLVTANLFLLPLLRRLLGAGDCLPVGIPARLLGELPAGGARREFRRGRWDGQNVRDGELHDSGALASLAACNCLIERAPDAPSCHDGDIVRVYCIENGGMA